MSDIESKIKAIQNAYFQELPTKLDAITTLWREYRASTEQQPETPKYLELYRLVHGLAGTAETFGLSELGKTAQEIETLLKDKKTADSMSKPLQEQISALIQQLHEHAK